MTLRVVDPHIHFWDMVPGNYPGLDNPGDGFLGDARPMCVPHLPQDLRQGASDVEILKVVQSGPKEREKLFEMIGELSTAIMTNTKLPPLPTQQAQAEPRQIPTEALTYYSRALLYEDRGDNAKAVDYYNRALNVFPAYAEATEGLRRVRPS